jgi:hypothetical protein
MEIVEEWIGEHQELLLLHWFGQNRMLQSFAFEKLHHDKMNFAGFIRGDFVIDIMNGTDVCMLTACLF